LIITSEPGYLNSEFKKFNKAEKLHATSHFFAHQILNHLKGFLFI